jgi:biopolymer transport protein ExbD
MENQSIQNLVFKRLNANKRAQINLRMTPMIDMIFLLLIFFFLASQWRPLEDFLPLKIPTASASENIGRPESLVIYISAKDGGCEVKVGNLEKISIANKTIENDIAGLMDGIKAIMTSQKRFANDPVEIICEPKVKWDYLAKIYSALYGFGISDITFTMTEQPQNASGN